MGKPMNKYQLFLHANSRCHDEWRVVFTVDDVELRSPLMTKGAAETLVRTLVNDFVIDPLAVGIDLDLRAAQMHSNGY